MTTYDDNVKYFDARVLASITTGVLLLEPFSLVHEAIEHIAGHPVWTHELPSYSRAITPSLMALYPWLPTSQPDDWEALAADLAWNYPNPLPARGGTGVRERDPISTLVDMLATTEE